jgi:Zn-dependent protease
MLNLPALPDLVSRIITLVIAFTIHELAHAWLAVQMGDETPRRMGRLTLNPLAHLDPIGSILLLVAGFGWAKPVQVNPYNLRFGPQLGMAAVAAAGPFSNLVMAALAAIPFRLGLLSLFDRGPLNAFLPSPSGFMLEFIQINLLLLLFNLIPIPPLDGFKILRGFAPRSLDSVFVQIEQWGVFLLMALVFLGQRVLSLILIGPMTFLFQALLGI